MGRVKKGKDLNDILELKYDIQKVVKELKEIADRMEVNSPEQYNMYIAINMIGQVGDGLWI